MASLLHETLVELLAEHPELLVPALQDQLGDLDVGLHYWDTLLAVLGDAIRSTLEMEMKDWKPRSDWGKRWLANIKREGREEARAEDRAASIVELLDVRGIPLDPPLRQRIAACTDYQLLTQWLRRAATATAAEEVFASGP